MENRSAVAASALFLAATLIAACSSGDDEAAIAKDEPAHCQPLRATLAVKDRMGQTVSHFNTGEPVTFQLAITNTSNSAVRFSQPDGCPSIHFEVRNGANQTLWSSRDGIVCLTLVTEGSYPAGATVTATQTWNQNGRDLAQVPDGNYEVESFDNTGCDHTLGKSAGFRIQ